MNADAVVYAAQCAISYLEQAESYFNRAFDASDVLVRYCVGEQYGEADNGFNAIYDLLRDLIRRAQAGEAKG